MVDSLQRIDMFSGAATSRGSNGYTMYLPRGCLKIYTPLLSDTTIPQGRTGLGLGLGLSGWECDCAIYDSTKHGGVVWCGAVWYYR